MKITKTSFIESFRFRSSGGLKETPRPTTFRFALFLDQATTCLGGFNLKKASETRVVAIYRESIRYCLGYWPVTLGRLHFTVHSLLEISKWRVKKDPVASCRGITSHTPMCTRNEIYHSIDIEPIQWKKQNNRSKY